MLHACVCVWNSRMYAICVPIYFGILYYARRQKPGEASAVGLLKKALLYRKGVAAQP